MAELPSYYQNRVDKSWLNVALGVTQLGAAGYTILLQALHGESVSKFVFPLYENLIGFLVLAPLAFYFEREQRPELRFSTVCRLFILGSIGVVINQVTYVTSLSTVSAIAKTTKYPSAMDSVTVLITFVLAGACWVEEIHVRRRDGQAKVLGIVITCCGALAMGVAKGPVLIRTILAGPDASTFLQLDASPESWQLGAISLIGSVSLAIYLILQVPILTRYPAPLSVAAFSCLFGALELAILSAIFEHDKAKWVLETGSQIYCVIYAGFFGTALALATHSWGVYRGGPVVVAIYQPLKVVFVCVLSAVILRQPLHVGSLIGAVLVIFGIYLVLWGREEQRRTGVDAQLTEHLWS